MGIIFALYTGVYSWCTGILSVYLGRSTSIYCWFFFTWIFVYSLPLNTPICRCFLSVCRCIYLPLYTAVYRCFFYLHRWIYIYLYILLFLLLHLLYKLFDLGHGRLVFGHQVGHLSLELWYTSKRLVHLAQGLFMLTDVLLELTGKIDKKNAINKGILIFTEEIIILEWIY